MIIYPECGESDLMRFDDRRSGIILFESDVLRPSPLNTSEACPGEFRG